MVGLEECEPFRNRTTRSEIEISDEEKSQAGDKKEYSPQVLHRLSKSDSEGQGASEVGGGGQAMMAGMGGRGRWAGRDPRGIERAERVMG